MRKRSVDDSLDLLLDTICNTFGGIVFISILVVILANSASESVGSSAPPDAETRRLIDNRRRLAESSARLDALRRAARQVEDLKDRFSDPESVSLLADMTTMQSATDQLHQKRDSDLDNLADSQILMNETAQELERLRSTIAATRQTLNSAKKQLEQEVAIRSRTSKLPRAESTTKKQMSFFLKEGRLCAFASIDASGNVRRNETESRVEVADGKQFAIPIVSSGLSVDPSGGNTDAIAAKFDGFDKDRHFLAIVVWEDSFEHFEAVKDTIVRLGFKYQLMPLAKDEKIYMGVAADAVQVQ